MTSRLLLFTVLLLLPVSLRADDAQASKEARLREALQNAYALLKTSQETTATLQAAQAESEKEKETLKTQVQTLTDQLKAEVTKSTLAAQTAHTQIGQLKLQVGLLQRKVEDDERRNLALFKLANEILTRYEDFSLGNALAAKEPFTGLTRTKLENLVQGYQDKIVAQRVGVNAPAAPAPTAPVSTAQTNTETK